MKFVTKEWCQKQFTSFADKISSIFAKKNDVEKDIAQINSNLAAKKIEVESEFASVIKVWRTGNIVSVDIDGDITMPKNIVVARNLPHAAYRPWVVDLQGRAWCVYESNDMACIEDLEGWVNLHFVYITK